MNFTSCCNHDDLHEIPFVSALLDLKKKMSTSVQTLPLSRGKSLKSPWLERAYRDLLGDSILDLEFTGAGEFLDAFFFPSRSLHQAEQLAATLFGADGTLFVTTGSTSSNQIALDAFQIAGARVLVDRQCHQSIHSFLNSARCDLDLVHPSVLCDEPDQHWWDLDDLLEQALWQQKSGNHYKLIAVNGHSYNGLIYDIPMVIEYLLQNGVRTRNFFVDETWAIGNYFLPQLASGTAMRMESLLKKFPDLVVVATQSAHKSMSCLRQASLIHYKGNGIRPILLNSRFKFHTTSPNYAILASLDLGRAQLQVEGTDLFREVARLAEKFSKSIQTNPHFDGYSIQTPRSDFIQPRHVRMDPTKIPLNTTRLGLSPLEIKRKLFEDHGIYVSHTTESSLWFHFHIGWNEEAVEQLLSALGKIAARTKRSCPQTLRSPVPLPSNRLDVSAKPISNPYQSNKEPSRTDSTVVSA